jgi:hypothetical protein
LTWAENPENNGLFTITNYRIYRKPKGTDDSQYSLVGEVDAGTFEYDDRGFSSAQDASSYEYAVTAVDSDGAESDYDIQTSFFSPTGKTKPVDELNRIK